ncbi:MAG: dihydroorotate dehydrogenase [Euryarchaeota archaeon]|jgi:dihydroorotate dehydrogenase (NAD+) catalytic subunit|uniref:dihydroorotate dehydrogenase n=1 Tax=Methanobacterium sp. MZD130B TaxID=3394378 RepID=UPI001773847D|nr:dihydroorotate dehydrogenase [Euryarchaeota archaeon]HHT18430.1 dihydroorotate dehydrogenase [Methanobacterium sp.]
MLEVEICQMKMKNPTALAAGVLGSTASSLNWASRSGVGAVVTKSFGLEPNKGYSNPTTVDVEGGIINAIGLSNPGVDIFTEELKKLDGNVPQIASIYGSTPEEFSQIASKVDKLVDALELNVSCPHAMEGCGAAIGQDPNLTIRIVEAVKKSVKSPVIVKLTPNVTDIVEIARAAESGGADALTLINSLGPGMRIDLETANPILSNRFGGMSGPAIKPVALRCVYQVHQAVNLPIMGVGGIMNYQDVVEFLYAGASCVQVGTAVMYHGLEVFREITSDLEKFMMRKGYQRVDEMVGLAHQK